MKTIFITIFQGVEAKNILRTDIYKKLLEDKELRIVFFVGSLERAQYYQKEFTHPNVIYEPITKSRTNWLEPIFSSLKFLLLRTDTVDLRRKMALEINLTGKKLKRE